MKLDDVRGNGSGAAVDRGLVTVGVASAAGAGLMTGPALAAAAAGRWLLLGTVLAGIVALLLYRLPLYRLPRAGTSNPVARALELAGRGAAAGVLAAAIDGYLRLDLAGPAELGALPVLAVVAAAVIVAPLVGLRPEHSRTAALVLTVVVFGTLALVIVACLAITPADPLGPPEQATPAGVPVAALIAGFGLLGAGAAGSKRATTLAVVVLVGGQLAVGAVLLYQLGPTRLALSTAPLRDALAAADASALVGVVGLVAALAMAAVLYRLLATAPTPTGAAGRTGLLAVLLGGALTATLVTPTVAVVAAVILMFAAHAVTGRGVPRTRPVSSDVNEPG